MAATPCFNFALSALSLVAVLRLGPLALAEEASVSRAAAGPLTAMPDYPESPDEYRNKWDPFVISALTGVKETMWTTNGRQVARSSTGAWFVLAGRDHKSLHLSFARGERVIGGAFDTVELVGPSASAVFKAQGPLTGGSMVVDRSDTLHVVWCDSGALLHAKRDIRAVDAAALADRAQWSGPTRLAEPTCEPGDIMLDADGKPAVCYSRDDTVFFLKLGASAETAAGAGAGMPPLVNPRSVGKVVEEKDPAAPVAVKPKTPSWPPPRPIQERRSQEAVMDLGPDGSVHIAFRRSFDIYYARRAPDGKWSPAERAAWGLASHPSIVCVGDQPLIAFQYEAVKPVEFDGPDYIVQREGGGASVGFAVRTPQGWRTDYLAKSEEIIVNRQGIWDKRFKGKLRPMVERMGPPVLFRDRHGVAWALWQNTTRRWSYCARWMGERFGEVHECRGPFCAPAAPVSAEKHMPAQGADVGLLFFAANRVILDRLKIPALSLEEDREVMFLDCLEVGSTSGLEFVVNQASKHPANPILSPGPLGSRDDRHVYAARVHKHGPLYVMRYGYRSWSERPWKFGATAISRDGVRWQRVDKLPDDLPPRDSDGQPETPLSRGYFDNPDPADPSKKYMRVNEFGPVWHQGSKRVVYSPDGKTWKDGPEVSVLNALYEGAGPNLWDTLDIPERRIKAYGRVFTANSRSCGMMWTHDLVHWHGAEHFLDPDQPYAKPPGTTSIGPLRGQVFLDACAGKNEDQIYSARVTIVDGLYFCVYWPCSFDHRYETALAVSRDGFNFTRVKNGSRTLPVGPAGAWDSGIVWWMDPLRDGDVLKEYYGGGAWHHGVEPYCPSRQIGLATIRVNGWTYYAPRPDEFRGTVTTIPIAAPAGVKRGLVVNVEGLAGRSDALAAEVLDAATGAALPGFTAAQCSPLAADGLAAAIAWQGGTAIPSGRPVRIRFHLRGKGVRLYSFAFVPAEG